MRNLTLIMLFIFGFACFAIGQRPVPAAWSKQSNPNYDLFTDISVHHGGKASGSIKSKASATNETFAPFTQAISARDYLGKRVRLSGYVKSQDVAGGAGLWMRVDGEDAKMLGFDNMLNRAIKGTADWARHEVVLDVPADSLAIYIGALLQGTGQIWVDDLKLEKVDSTVPSTNLKITPEEEKQNAMENEKFKKENPNGHQRFIDINRSLVKNGPFAIRNGDFEEKQP